MERKSDSYDRNSVPHEEIYTVHKSEEQQLLETRTFILSLGGQEVLR